jgi:sugar lactone lactonase YvrE
MHGDQMLRFDRAPRKAIELLFVGLSVTLAGCGSNTTNKAKLPKGAELDAGPGATDSGALDAGPPLVTLAGPAEFNGANGIRFDGKGKLYVGSVANGKLYRIDPDTGETLTTLGAESGVTSPDDLVIAPDGTLYVANIVQGTIVAISPDGANHVVATPGPGVDGIALSPDGKLIIGKDFFADGLYVVNPAADAEAPRLLNATPGWINAMAFSPDGTLYAPVWKEKYVATIDPDTGAVTQFSEKFTGTAGSVRFDSKGNLHAVDGGNGDVHRIDAKTGALSTLAHYGMPLDNLAFDAKDRLFVSSYADGSVNEVLSDGSFRVVKHGGLTAPVALAVASDAAETVYVGDANGVQELDGVKGAHLGGFGEVLAVQAIRVVPVALRVAGDSLLALGPAALESWDRSTGDVKSSTAVIGGEDVVEFADGILVSQPMTGNVVKMTDTGATPYVSGLGDPAGLASSSTNLFVSVYTAGEIRQIAEGGQPLDPPRVVASGLGLPEGLAVLPDGNLAVVETRTGDVVRVDRKTGDRTVLASAVSPSVATGTPAALGTLNAIAVGASRYLYVLSPVDKKVVKVRF